MGSGGRNAADPTGPGSAFLLLHPSWQPAERTLALLSSTVLLGGLAQVLFSWNERRARRRCWYNPTL